MRNMIETTKTSAEQLQANEEALDCFTASRKVREALSRLSSEQIHELAMAPWVELRAGVIK